jgi:hypothetical protein
MRRLARCLDRFADPPEDGPARADLRPEHLQEVGRGDLVLCQVADAGKVHPTKVLDHRVVGVDALRLGPKRVTREVEMLCKGAPLYTLRLEVTLNTW